MQVPGIRREHSIQVTADVRRFESYMVYCGSHVKGYRNWQTVFLNWRMMGFESPYPMATLGGQNPFAHLLSAFLKGFNHPQWGVR